jgi:hypothetical protein
MNEPTEHGFDFLRSLFGFRITFSIQPPKDDLFLRRLEWLGLRPPTDLDKIMERYIELVQRALAGADRVLIEELAEEQGVKPKIRIATDDGTFDTEKVRGRHEPVFKFRRGRAKGSHRKKNPVTYDGILASVLRYRGNVYGDPPTRQEIAKMLKCSPPTITTELRQHGVKGRGEEFVKAVLNE